MLSCVSWVCNLFGLLGFPLVETKSLSLEGDSRGEREEKKSLKAKREEESGGKERGIWFFSLVTFGE